MERIFRLLFNIKELQHRYDDDYVDRLSKRYTVSVLLFFTLIVTTTQYVGSPIRCWCPAQFTDSHKLYANTICWVDNTYYVPFEKQIPLVGQPRQMISYYQWVPIILMGQAVLCYLPSILWSFLYRQSGLSVVTFMSAATTGQRSAAAETRARGIQFMVDQLDSHVRKSGKGRYACSQAPCIGQLRGSYLIISYLFIKLLYFGNALGQIYTLDLFLGGGFHFYGIDVIKRALLGEDWAVSLRFPRVTLCDFKIRHQTVNHRYILQCVLPINLFNEKIFIFIWFWLAMVSICTTLSFIRWAWLSFSGSGQVSFVKNHIARFNSDKSPSRELKRFSKHYLKRDGLFVLRLLGENLGSVVVSDVLGGLWEKYSAERRHIESERQRAATDVSTQPNYKPRLFPTPASAENV